MKVRLIKTFNFEAAHAHQVPGGAASRLHGHRFYVHVSQTGETNPDLGWLIDYGEIKAIVKPVITQLDHRYLNEMKGLESGDPRDIGMWVRKGIAGSLPFPVEVAVTCRESMDYEPSSVGPDSIFHYYERISFRFEAAHSLPKTPVGHKCRRLHGHSYEVQAACEERRDLIHHLEKIFCSLNYSHLNEIPGLANPTAEILCGWIWRRLEGQGITPQVIMVGETCEAICVYRGE